MCKILLGGGVELSFVVPCYNESLNLDNFYLQILNQINIINEQNSKQINCEFIFINDGSTDNTLEILKALALKDNRIKILNFSRNFGKEAAILAGLQHSNAKATILIDADLQDPVELIPTMYKKFITQSIDMVCVRRIDRKGESKIRAFFSDMFYKISRFMSEIYLQSGVRDFRLMSKEVVDAILQLGEYHRFSKAIFEWVGYSKIYLEYEYIPRNAGSSGWSFWKLFKYGIEGLISFSTMPLRLAFILGFGASFGAFIYMIILILDTLIYGNDVRGYPSLMCVVIFFSGVILIVLGIIGEYIARIYEQVKNRPNYILKDENELQN